MCLHLNSHSKTNKAKKNIYVWKAFEIHIHGNRVFSPFKYYPYELGKLYEQSDLNFDMFLLCGEIHEGFHSYVSKNALLKHYAFQNYHEFVIIRCIIPKGAKYIKGNYGNTENNGVVSDKILIPKTFTFRGIKYHTDKQGTLLKK